MITPFFIPLAYLLWKIQSCFAVSSNRTIDDFYGDPITGFIPFYEPHKAWNAVANGNCSICFVHVDPTQTSNDTWHDSNLIFNSEEQQRPFICDNSIYGDPGTAVYLFSVILNLTPSDPLVDYNLTFTLDDTLSGTFMHLAQTTSNDISYHVPIFASTGLASQPHTLIARTASPSIFIFDYAIYTVEDNITSSGTAQPATPSSTGESASAQHPVEDSITSSGTARPVTSSSTGESASDQHPSSLSALNLGAIISASICGFLAASLLSGILYFRGRRRSAKNSGTQDMENGHITPWTGGVGINPTLSPEMITDSTSLPPYTPLETPHQTPTIRKNR
ncbi:hypothetical protein C8J57DRAFT_1681202 [Mycena rebaudengoi]|nr:hypothetical protein C8J57DRAFT_1681202 [Mycena rebaudengoi]